MAAEKPKTVSDVLKEFNKKSDFAVGPMGTTLENVKAFSSGHFALDLIIGVGGIPIGRSLEFYGPPSSGKTTAALQCGAEVQQNMGRRVGFFDYEQAMDAAYAKALGLDTDADSFIFGQPDTFEDGMNLARKLIATNEMGLFIVDSVAAMTPRDVIDMDTGAYRPGRQAALMSQVLQQLNPLLKQHECSMIFLNHIQEVFEMGGAAKPGVPKRKTTPGGKALKFYASVRLEFNQIGSVKEEIYDPLTNAPHEEVIGQTTTVKVIKNKVAPPFRSALLRVYFGKGFSEPWSALQVLIGHKKVVKGTAGYYFFDHAPELVTDDMPRREDGTPRPYLRGEKAILAKAERDAEWGRKLVAMAKALLAQDESVEGFDAAGENPVVDEEQEADPLAELAAAGIAIVG